MGSSRRRRPWRLGGRRGLAGQVRRALARRRRRQALAAAAGAEAQKRWDDAAAAYRTAIAQRDAPVLQARLGRVLARSGRWEEAEQAYRAALDRRGPRAPWLSLLGQTLLRQRRWDEAAHAFEAALALDDSRLADWERLATARERLRQWPDAERAYRAALDRGGPRAPWLSRLGQAVVRQQRWDEAAQAFEAALGLDGGRLPDWERLGTVRERLGQWPDAHRAYSGWLERDPAATDVERRLLAADSRRFPARRLLLRFVAEHLLEIRQHAADARTDTVPGPLRLWTYWGQGWDAAPAVPRLCLQQLRALHPEAELVVLDDEQLASWVDLPPEVSRLRDSDRAAFSDALRVELLARYGGVWVDATCLVRDRLPERLPELLASGFFAPRWTDTRMATWLMASEPGGHVVTLLRAALHLYWREHHRKVDYFLPHCLFEALLLLDEPCRAHWDATPSLPADPAHALARAMREPYDDQRLQSLLATSFVQKLTHKITPETGPEGSILAALVDQPALLHGRGERLS